MTKEEIYGECIQKLGRTTSLLLELPTGYGKSKLSIDLVNWLCTTQYRGRPVRMLLLVAKTVHKRTWKEEFAKWGGIRASEVVMECYESLKKHVGEKFEVIVADEVHHIGSELRLQLLESVSFTYMLGLSATIPRDLKQHMKYRYQAGVVSCKLLEAIEEEILPEPDILLFPLQLDNTKATEYYVINPKAEGEAVTVEYKDIWKWKRQKKQKVFVRCTQRQKVNEMNAQILWEKNKYMGSRSKVFERMWLYHCGKRLEYLANCKIPVVQRILRYLEPFRTITFCKTIEQCEALGENCIHSQNIKASQIYENFNLRLINHITAVNILNENANLVDCKYAIFGNLSSSDTVVLQRLGRSLRHKNPVIIVPYYENTREEELVSKMVEGLDKSFVYTIHSVEEIG